MDEKFYIRMRKTNMKLYPIYKMIGFDFLFFYSVKILYLTQIKCISSADIMFSVAFFAFASILLQIPVTIISNKFGPKRDIIIGNALNFIYIILIMFSNNIYHLIIAETICAFAFSFKSISESTLLNISIPTAKGKPDIFSRIDSKGYSKYFYLLAISSFISGFLYDINPYIPFIIALFFQFLAVIIPFGFIEPLNRTMTDSQNYKDYISELKSGFNFIFKSSRLKPLILMLSIILSISFLVGDYQLLVMEYIHLSATHIGILVSVLQLITGLSSKKAINFNFKFKNKSLTIIGLTICLSAVISGILVILRPSFIIMYIILILSFLIARSAQGVFQILEQRYLANFTDSNILPKIHSVRGLILNSVRAVINMIGSYILIHTTIDYAIFIIGFLSVAIILASSLYMKSRVGLSPQEYQQKDIDYKYYTK